MLIGIDVGYGNTKAYNGELLVWPSVLGRAVDLRYSGDLVRGQAEAYGVNDRYYFVGHDAITQSRVHETPKARDRVDTDFALVMVLAGLHKLGARQGELCRVVTGLPLEWYKEDKGKLEAKLGGAIKFSVGGEPVNLVLESKVLPQHLGSVFYQILDDEGQQSAGAEALFDQSVGVVDIGTYTTGLFATVEGLQYVDRWSGSMHNGTYLIEKVVREQGIDLPVGIHTLGKTLAEGKPLREWGKPIAGLDEAVRLGIESLAHEVLAYMLDVWGDGRQFDTIFVTGGGAHLIGQEIREGYPQAVVVNRAMEANVIGFYRFGRRQWK